MINQLKGQTMIEIINEPVKFDKAWVQEIKDKMEARKKAIREGTLITKDNGNTEKSK